MPQKGDKVLKSKINTNNKNQNVATNNAALGLTRGFDYTTGFCFRKFL